jgi:hypothetical protein
MILTSDTGKRPEPEAAPLSPRGQSSQAIRFIVKIPGEEILARARMAAHQVSEENDCA